MEIRIKGRVLGYSDVVSAGVIQAEDGNKYQFEKSEWRSKGAPISHGVVSFSMNHGRVTEVEAA